MIFLSASKTPIPLDTDVCRRVAPLFYTDWARGQTRRETAKTLRDDGSV